MEKYIEEIVSRGYSIVSNEIDMVSFANESVNYCCILIQSYEGLYDPNEEKLERLFELEGILKSKYSFANKGIILIIVDIPVDKERSKIERDVYNYIKTYVDNIDILPSKINKDITISFKTMDASMVGFDIIAGKEISMNSSTVYVIDPFEEFDGISVQNYLKFLNTVNEDSIVYYPKIYEPQFIRYVANKFYTVSW